MDDLHRLACRALNIAGQKNLTVVTAESCTAGKLTALLSEAPGATERLHGSFVAYTKANKTRALGVPADLLAEKGAVCPPVQTPTKTEIRLGGCASVSRATV